MRRKTLRSIACAIAMVLALSVTACGDSDIDVDDVEDTFDIEEDDEEPEEVDDDEDELDDEYDDEDEAEVDDEEDAEIDDEEDADVEDEADAEDEEDEEEEPEYASLEEAFADPDVKAGMDSIIASMEEDGMTVFYEVIGNEFSVTYQFTELVVDDVEGLAESLEAAMDQLEGVFVEFAEMFDEELGEEGACTVTVRYLDAADTVLYEGAFSAE